MSRDIAEIYILIESSRREFNERSLPVKILEPWSEHPSIQDSPVVTSRIEAPTSEGSSKVYLIKSPTGKKPFIAVDSLENLDEFYKDIWNVHPLGSDKIGSSPVTFRKVKYANDKIYIDAVTAYAFFSLDVEKRSKDIIDRLVKLKKKYDNSPVYIEGFTLGLPFTVDFHFKLK